MRAQSSMAVAATVLTCSMTIRTAMAQAGPPPAVIFSAPDAGADTLRARALFESLAREQGTVFVDLVRRAGPAPQANKLVQQAIEAYGALRYDEVLRVLDMALTEATATGGHGLSPRELSDLFVYRGLVHRQRGDEVGAWGDFLRAATQAPTRHLDPLRFPPSALAMFERAQKTIRAAQFARVVAQLDDGCRLWIDGREMAAGATPEVPTGDHFVRVACVGYQPFGGVVTWTQPEHALAPQLKKVPTLALDDVRRLAQEAGARSFVWIDVRPSTKIGGTLRMRLFQDGSRSPNEEVLARLKKPQIATRAVAAMFARAMGKAPDIVSGPVTTPWYKKPWVWGVAGAALATAIILPFALNGNPDGFNLIVVEP